MRGPTVGSAGTTSTVGSGRGFQPSARRRNRIAAGVLLTAIAIGGNALVYTSLDDAEPVVQVVVDVPAGELITADMLRTVQVDADSTVNLVGGERLGSLVGTYAKVRLVSGALMTAESVQSTPLVSEGSAVVAIQVAEGTLPIGLRERVPIILVVPAGASAAGESGPTSIDGRVIGLPTPTESALGVESLSVEVAFADAPAIASAADVRVVLIEPTDDPATADGDPADNTGDDEGDS